MPMHQGLLPREGLVADPIFRLIGRTALNPALVLPLLLLARYTKKGGDLAVLHPTAFSRLKKLAWLSIAKAVNRWLSTRALNNWVSDRYDWSKEIVLVTGGAGGIGGQVVQLFAERGITVVVLDIQELTFTAASNVHYFKCDITSTEKLAAVAGEIRARVGHPTILINNAGVARGKSVLDATERDIRFTFDVNTLAHFWTVKEFLPNMVAKNHGMVVTIASYAAWLTVPSMTDYGGSKAAAQSFHEGLSAELVTKYNAPRVRTVLVNQGYTKTPLFTGYQQGLHFLIPALEPETVAEAVVKKVLEGTSGQVILPGAGSLVNLVRMMPHWYQHRLRCHGKKLMTNFAGRQVVKDVEKYYADKEQQDRPEESTVLVGEQGANGMQ
ncbi:dehydrogenase reductase sdr family member 8 [Colletotrichum plurivorum]|uniref:Short-chain dehydrogenase/reductase 3 n=1 Tax=Colletotrichum plurivorum TaxID=2175906 RepID=A0A8H6NRH9_9PEZI|nr:dehydrogenase reductase sdr family member 8 [Colletotrichum plurivorum]